MLSDLKTKLIESNWRVWALTGVFLWLWTRWHLPQNKLVLSFSMCTVWAVPTVTARIRLLKSHVVSDEPVINDVGVQYVDASCRACYCSWFIWERKNGRSRRWGVAVSAWRVLFDAWLEVEWLPSLEEHLQQTWSMFFLKGFWATCIDFLSIGEVCIYNYIISFVYFYYLLTNCGCFYSNGMPEQEQDTTHQEKRAIFPYHGNQAKLIQITRPSQDLSVSVGGNSPYLMAARSNELNVPPPEIRV